MHIILKLYTYTCHCKYTYNQTYNYKQDEKEKEETKSDIREEYRDTSAKQKILRNVMETEVAKATKEVGLAV